MKIAVDIRSLSGGYVSGVENYILNALEHLIPLDAQNKYTLFYNSFGRVPKLNFHFINSETKITRIPNKLLNLALWTNTVKLEKLVGGFDCLFMPNLNQFSLLPKTKLVLTVHDMSPVIAPEFYNVQRRLWHAFLNYKKAFQRANLIFAVSEYTKRDIINLYGIPEHKIVVAYPGINKDVYNRNISEEKLRAVRNTYGLPGDYIAFVNTIEPRKNLENLLQAYEQLDGKTNLVIVGRSGWKNRKIFSRMKRSRKARLIKYYGYIASEHDKAAIVKMARCLAYPSFYEGFGFQPLESMALGVPTVVSQVTSLPEVVGDASVLVDPFSVDSIATGLTRALYDTELRKMLVEKGKERVEKFLWNTMAKQILERINSI